MRKNLFSSLLLALLASASVAVSAAEAPKAEVAKPAVTQPAQPAQAVQATAAVKVDLNTADAATLERELQGIGPAKARPSSTTDRLMAPSLRWTSCWRSRESALRHWKRTAIA